VTTRSILHQIACRGYAVRLRRTNGQVEAQAISLTDPSQRHISRSFNGDGEAEARAAVLALAKMVGVEAEGKQYDSPP
jgi:hypothetical protein